MILEYFAFRASNASALVSHYADSHRGICLQFSCSYGTLIGLARQVVYKEGREPILIPLHYQTDDQLTDKMVLVKAAFWAYENEYRIIGHARADWGHSFDGNWRVAFTPELLCGVTLGARISADNRAEVLALAAPARTVPTPVWQAIEDDGEFWMRVERVA